MGLGASRNHEFPILQNAITFQLINITFHLNIIIFRFNIPIPTPASVWSGPVDCIGGPVNSFLDVGWELSLEVSRFDTFAW